MSQENLGEKTVDVVDSSNNIESQQNDSSKKTNISQKESSDMNNKDKILLKTSIIPKLDFNNDQNVTLTEHPFTAPSQKSCHKKLFSKSTKSTMNATPRTPKVGNSTDEFPLSLKLHTNPMILVTVYF